MCAPRAAAVRLPHLVKMLHTEGFRGEEEKNVKDCFSYEFWVGFFRLLSKISFICSFPESWKPHKCPLPLPQENKG